MPISQKCTTTSSASKERIGLERARRRDALRQEVAELIGQARRLNDPRIRTMAAAEVPHFGVRLPVLEVTVANEDAGAVAAALENALDVVAVGRHANARSWLSRIFRRVETQVLRYAPRGIFDATDASSLPVNWFEARQVADYVVGRILADAAAGVLKGVRDAYVILCVGPGNEIYYPQVQDDKYESGCSPEGESDPPGYTAGIVIEVAPKEAAGVHTHVEETLNRGHPSSLGSGAESAGRVYLHRQSTEYCREKTETRLVDLSYAVRYDPKASWQRTHPQRWSLYELPLEDTYVRLRRLGIEGIPPPRVGRGRALLHYSR
jgi:hypothetical protein